MRGPHAETRPHAPRPPPCHLICVSFCTTHPKKKRADKKMKIRCDFWPLPGSSATLIAGNKAWHTAWNTDKHVVMPHTHRDRHSLGMELYLCTYRPTEICDTHSFLKRIPHARQLAPGSISLPLLPCPFMPSLPRSFSFSFLSCESFNHIRHITQNAKHGGLTK